MSAHASHLQGKWKAYPAYRDSGVEWLGEIPVHWEMKRVKNGYEVRLGKNASTRTILFAGYS